MRLAIITSVVILSLLIQLFIQLRVKKYPVQRGGTVLIVGVGLTGPLKDAAFALADEGLYVLAGVDTISSARSIQASAPKGLETLVLDIEEPAHLATATYRVQEIVRDLDRPLVGLIILRPDGPSFSRNMRRNHGVDIVKEMLDIKGLEISWSKSYRSPMQLISALLPMFLDPEENGGRIVVIQSAAYLARSLKRKDYLFHSSFIDTLSLLQSDIMEEHNVSLSVISASFDEMRRSEEVALNMKQAIINSILSPKPRAFYDIGYYNLSIGTNFEYISNYISFPTKIRIPLWFYRIIAEFLPESFSSAIARMLVMRTLKSPSGLRKQVRRGRAKKKKAKHGLNTYEHLAMKS